MNIGPILIAATGGILPALAWLWFWLREDKQNPEPRRLIALAFVGGMIAVLIVVPIEKSVEPFFGDQTVLFSVWSAIEEATKFLVALALVLTRRDDDEPIDAVIYMIVTALGFAALENTLFLMNPNLAGSTVPAVIETADMRAVGATLLHVFSSALIGVSFALAFYKSRLTKTIYVSLGVILAAILHSTFNFLILNTPESEVLRTFSFVWIGIIVLLAAVEWIKHFRPSTVRR